LGETPGRTDFPLAWTAKDFKPSHQKGRVSGPEMAFKEMERLIRTHGLTGKRPGHLARCTVGELALLPKA